MSSAVSIQFDPDTTGVGSRVPIEDFLIFCEEHDIRHSPHTVGGNVYYQDLVEVHYNKHCLQLSTYWMGREMPDVARLAVLAWARWGGTLSADPEIRSLIASQLIAPKLADDDMEALRHTRQLLVRRDEPFDRRAIAVLDHLLIGVQP